MIVRLGFKHSRGVEFEFKCLIITILIFYTYYQHLWLPLNIIVFKPKIDAVEWLYRHINLMDYTHQPHDLVNNDFKWLCMIVSQ